MGCEGLHCPGCGKTGGGGALAILVTAGLTWWITANIVLVCVCTAPVAAVAVVVLVRKIRRELCEPVWHPGYATVGARVNGPAAPPMLTAEQLAGLAELGQAIHDVQAADAREAITSRRTS
jgi:hypothetical protein